MKKLFIDTNVLIDFLLPNRPHHEEAKALIDECVEVDRKIFLSVSSVCTLCYFLEKYKIPNSQIAETMRLLAKGFQLANTTKEDIIKSSYSSFDDLEDAILYFTAVSHGCEAFVTQNTRDFPSTTEILVDTPVKILQALNHN